MTIVFIKSKSEKILDFNFEYSKGLAKIKISLILSDPEEMRIKNWLQTINIYLKNR